MMNRFLLLFLSFNAFVSGFASDCPPGLLKEDTCSLQALLEGCTEYPTCSESCKEQNLALSLDKEHCVKCGNISTYDDNRAECICPNGFRRTEIFARNASTPVLHECLPCPAGSTVLPSSLISSGENYHRTAGVDFVPDAFSCSSCPSGMLFDDEFQCKCKDNRVLSGEAAVGPQSCIDEIYLPTVSTGYSQLKFDFLLDKIDQSTKSVMVNSIVASHYYLEAASRCEFYKSNSQSHLQGCESLMNLCVMSSYDQTSAPCKEVDTISRTRNALVAPVYEKDSDDILRDTAVKMKMSLRKKEGYETVLDFRLAKYTMDGEFKGFERLANHFVSCIGGMALAGPPRSPEISFGKALHIEGDCNLEELMNRETFFYELYLLDKGTSCAEETDCLIPVPVFTTSFRFGSTFPNMNRGYGSVSDDKFVRRFMISDNLSGRTVKGLQILRYASDITIRTTIQEAGHSQIYTPVLNIKYSERSVKDAPPLKGRINFKAEFTMVTTKFWNAVKIMSGFVSTCALLLWAFRIYNWDSRNRKQSLSNGFSTGFHCTPTIYHVIVLGMHTIAMTFLPFTLAISFFWYLFYVLQDSVFLMLPSSENEFLFFYIMIVSFFVIQTIYIIHIIYQQCHIDVAFVDWERRKDQYSSVSVWRKVQMANEFDSLQTSRKTSIEFTILFVTAILSRTRNYDRHNVITLFALIFISWAFAVAIQSIWRSFFFERYIREPKTQRFIDLSTLANISLVLRDSKYGGYMLHCQSPYEFSDCSMEDLCDNLRNEGRGIVASRGLESKGGPKNCQTFLLFLSDKFQMNIQSYYEESDQIIAAEGMQEFLSSFIEQTPSPQSEGLRYFIRALGTFEKCLGLVPVEARGSPDSPCIVSPDQPTWAMDYRWTSCLFLGIEVHLTIHDFLTFSVANIAFKDLYMSAIITYSMHLIRTETRRFFGVRNLAKKSFLEQKFLSR